MPKPPRPPEPDWPRAHEDARNPWLDPFRDIRAWQRRRKMRQIIRTAAAIDSGAVVRRGTEIRIGQLEPTTFVVSAWLLAEAKKLLAKMREETAMEAFEAGVRNTARNAKPKTRAAGA